ncbi:MAG: cadmium-translocating P-type ATPase [Flavobacteriales bacterium]|nr:cadmium-translocating P-type ATPase [Flavobacteriales bacterium]
MMKKHKNDITLEVDGMTCANCATSVTKSIVKAGGTDVDVNFATGKANFVLPETSSIDQIKKEIDRHGYTAHDAQEGDPHHGHDHSEEGLSRLEKRFYFTLLFTIPLFSHMFLPFVDLLQNPVVQLVLCLPVLYIGLAHFGKSAVKALASGVFHMDVLIFTGFNAAFAYSVAGTIMHWGTPELHNYLFYETCATIITLVLMGNVLEHRSVKQTTTAISELSEIRAKKALRITPGSEPEETTEVDYDTIKIGDTLRVNTGDKIPVDGKLTWGEATVDESMITGESIPIDKSLSDQLIGGTIMLHGSIKMRASGVGENTVLSKIIELVKRAQQNKPEIQRLGDRVSSIFVPSVLLISAGTFLLSYFLFDIALGRAVMSSIAVLVISCPCAMGLATPTAVIAGIGRAAKKGILIKGGRTLEEFAKIQTIVFDKTGTLTTGAFKIDAIKPLNGHSENEIKNMLYSIEQYSSHPIAKSIKRSLKDSASLIEFSEVTEEKGVGMFGKMSNGDEIRLGSSKVLKDSGALGTHSLYMVKNNELMATIELVDEIKGHAKEMVRAMKRLGIKTILLSGDSQSNCQIVAAELGIEEVYSEQMPDQKLMKISALAAEGFTAMVGDGINDAPALSQATVGISMGGATQVAIESAQVVLLKSNDLAVIAHAFQISKHTYLTIKQNLFWAFAYNLVAIPMAAMGMLNPMVGALAMAFSDVIVIGNSIRLKTKRIPS